jgi:hypothetical protein
MGMYCYLAKLKKKKKTHQFLPFYCGCSPSPPFQEKKKKLCDLLLLLQLQKKRWE